MLTMVLSILNRITGAALYFGTLFVMWWLISAAISAEYFNYVQAVYSSWFGRLVLFGYTFALVHHALGGIRHLIWDTGRGFDLDSVEKSARLLVIASPVITIGLWVIAYWVR